MAGPGNTTRILAERIRALETVFRPGMAATIPLDRDGLGGLFPEGQLAAGSLVELLPRVSGAGAWTLALLLARHALGESKTLVITDPDRCFYPPAVRKLGIDLGRTILLRPRTAGEALLATAQALRSSAIGATVGAFERLADRDGRRLQLAAESAGTLGVLLRPVSALGSPSFAAVRWLIDPLPSVHHRRRMRLEVIRCRGGQEGKTVCLEIDDATGHVRAFSPVEPAAESAATA